MAKELEELKAENKRLKHMLELCTEDARRAWLEIVSMRQCFEQTEADRDFYRLQASHLKHDVARLTQENTNGIAGQSLQL